MPTFNGLHYSPDADVSVSFLDLDVFPVLSRQPRIAEKVLHHSTPIDDHYSASIAHKSDDTGNEHDSRPQRSFIGGDDVHVV